MREIKFRVYDPESKLMMSWDELSHSRMFNIQQSHDDIGWEWMQYTGLKDKNGKEIYEGDIIDIHPVNPHRHNSKKRNVIQWINGGLFLKSIDGSILGYGELPSGHRIEVVSNIYENPNLLEVEG